MENFAILYENLLKFGWQDIVMILLGCLLIFLAIKKEMEPSLLLPMGFGTILVNIPGADVIKSEIVTLLTTGAKRISEQMDIMAGISRPMGQ